ncbi:hypothetical protein YUWDRAFT_06517 [Streptomyces sp. AmelKG-D3]|nr:hypothetical protein YUWDRAFT_06517 [Streptomyces sp. AmelKG-D3]
MEMWENSRCSILFHFEVPGGMWQTVMSKPVSAARAATGVFDQLHQTLLAELNAAGELDWSRACVDGSHIRAKKGDLTPVRRRSTGGRRAANTT